MKLIDGFILRTVAGETVVIPSGNEINLNMMITLNETGKFLWERIEKGTDTDTLVNGLLETYDVDKKTAEEAVKRFVEKLEKNGFLR